MKYPMEHRIIRPQPYTPECATDIRKTFARVRKQLGPQKTTEKIVIEADVKLAPTQKLASRFGIVRVK
jgi:hypothetical protein